MVKFHNYCFNEFSFSTPFKTWNSLHFRDLLTYFPTLPDFVCQFTTFLRSLKNEIWFLTFSRFSRPEGILRDLEVPRYDLTGSRYLDGPNVQVVQTWLHQTWSLFPYQLKELCSLCITKILMVSPMCCQYSPLIRDVPVYHLTSSRLSGWTWYSSGSNFIILNLVPFPIPIKGSIVAASKIHLKQILFSLWWVSILAIAASPSRDA